MASAAVAAVVVVVALIGIASVARADTVLVNGGFESGSGGAAAGWTSATRYYYTPGLPIVPDAGRVQSLQELLPPSGSWMAFATTYEYTNQALLSAPVLVGAPHLSFVADFLTHERYEPDPRFPPTLLAYNDSFLLTIHSDDPGAPADRTIVLTDLLHVYLEPGAAGYRHHSGFLPYEVDVADWLGFTTTFKFGVEHRVDGRVDSAFLLDDVQLHAAPLPTALASSGALGLAAIAWGVLRRRRLAEALQAR